MKKKLLSLGMALTVFLLLAFVPRFGWRIEGGGELYKYISTKQSDNATELVYQSHKHKLSVIYSSRLMRDFTVRYDDEAPASFNVSIDGKIIGEETAIPDMALLSELVWKDISGIFFYRYLLSLALLAFSLFAFIKPERTKIGNQNFFATPLFLSALIALRVIL